MTVGMYGATINVTSSLFTYNKGDYYGLPSPCFLFNDNFLILFLYIGAAIGVYSYAILEVSSSVFARNSAKSGGAIYTYYHTSACIRTYFASYSKEKKKKKQEKKKKK
jgi:hypothetical protein